MQPPGASETGLCVLGQVHLWALACFKSEHSNGLNKWNTIGITQQQDMHGPEKGNVTVALQLRKQRDTLLNAS